MLLANTDIVVQLSDEDEAAFLQQNFPTILTLFSAEHLAETTARLKKLKEMRANKLFGETRKE